jgi:hypothetical protein
LGQSKKIFFWTALDFLMNTSLLKARKDKYYAVFGSQASQKLHKKEILVPSAVAIRAWGWPFLFGQPPML